MPLSGRRRCPSSIHERCHQSTCGAPYCSPSLIAKSVETRLDERPCFSNSSMDVGKPLPQAYPLSYHPQSEINSRVSQAQLHAQRGRQTSTSSTASCHFARLPSQRSDRLLGEAVRLLPIDRLRQRAHVVEALGLVLQRRDPP
eukprot:95480-Pyramimonas_sp.AAC.1